MGPALAGELCPGTGGLMAPDFELNTVRTPYYIVDENLLVKNLEV